MIALHSHGHSVPEFRIQWLRGRPVRSRTVGVAGVVLEFERRAYGCAVQVRVGAHVAVEGVGFVDVEIARVDFVHSETGVEVSQGGHGGPDPA